MYHSDMGNRTGVVVAVVAFVVAGIALIVWSSMGLSQVTVEACFTFNGLSECRVASGTTREEALRTAADMACAVISSGMTDRINCQNTEPTRVEWR